MQARICCVVVFYLWEITDISYRINKKTNTNDWAVIFEKSQFIHSETPEFSAPNFFGFGSGPTPVRFGYGIPQGPR
jgi:hypothetical protein